MGTGNPYLSTVVEIEEPVLMVVGYSEAAIDYGIAGEKHWCKLVRARHIEGRPVSDALADAGGTVMAKVARGPDNWVGIFTPGELGFYHDDWTGDYYCYTELAD